MYDIIIPSCKPFEEIQLHASLIRHYDPEGSYYNYIPTGFSTSASVNRNYGLIQAFKTNNKYIIMIDDDIGGFFEHWQDAITEPLKKNKLISISSARLTSHEGSLSPMMYTDSLIDKPLSEVTKALPSAAIAFRKIDIIDNEKLRFCMNMIGSGWEDTLFCRLMNKIHMQKRFVVVNTCRLFHYHEMKNQTDHFDYNHRVYQMEIAKEGIHE